MTDPVTPFYDHLAGDYGTLIRQLVPRYEELTEVVCSLVCREDPGSVLEIGPGDGALTADLLRRLPSARVTAVEGSHQMAIRARGAVSAYGDRGVVIHEDIREYAAAGVVDVVCASLVLHNVPAAERGLVLRRISSWLAPGGLFVWSEFVRYEDASYQEAVHHRRRAFALEAGCPEAVVAWNFRKEVEDDDPPTVREVFEGARPAGFATVDLVWAHDAFAVFSLRTPRSR